MDDLVDEQREEDAGDDPELKERAQPSARLLRCDLGDVNRADDRRRSDPQPAQKPRGEKLLEGPWQGGENAGDREECGAEKEHLLAAEPIGEEPRAHRPGDAALVVLHNSGWVLAIYASQKKMVTLGD